MDHEKIPSKEVFGANISAILEARGWTVTRFAEAVGVTRQMFHRYLKGEALPQADGLDRFGSVVGVPVWQLLQPEQEWTHAPCEACGGTGGVTKPSTTYQPLPDAGDDA